VCAWTCESAQAGEGEGVSVGRGIQNSVRQRINANRQRIEEARLRDEREREAIKLLNQKRTGEQRND
jgi:hypothetical protein